jgi:hypothetical protein
MGAHLDVEPFPDRTTSLQKIEDFTLNAKSLQFGSLTIEAIENSYRKTYADIGNVSFLEYSVN